MTQLRKLWLDGNQLTQLPEELGDCSALQVGHVRLIWVFGGPPIVWFRASSLQEALQVLPSRWCGGTVSQQLVIYSLPSLQHVGANDREQAETCSRQCSAFYL